jgi:hypothetical protein
MEKVLAVREAIVHAFHQASAAQAPRPPQAGPADAGAELAALQTAGAGLARAMEALPEVQDMETTPAGGGDAGAGPPPAAAAAAPSPALGGGAAADRQAAQSATLGAICACEGVRAAEAPTSLLAAHGEAGVALDGAALQGAASVPPASDTEMAEAIQEMTEPAQLVQYWQSWTLDLKASWEAAEAASFAGAPAAALDASMQKMTQIWWHTAHLKPAFLTQLTYAALPKEAAQQAKWAEIAVRGGRPAAGSRRGFSLARALVAGPTAFTLLIAFCARPPRAGQDPARDERRQRGRDAARLAQLLQAPGQGRHRRGE